MKSNRCIAALIISHFLLAQYALATIVDLRPGVGSSGTIGGVLYQFDKTQPAGTGILDPFLRVQGSSTQEGYNTSNASVPFDDKPGPWTHDLQFGSLAPSGGLYQIVLDINEPNGGSAALLSLDKLQIYVSNIGSRNTTVLSSLGTLLYDMDAGGNSAVYMDYSNAPGSGVSDVLISFPASIFAGVTNSQYIILYARLGDTYSSADGFEEWSALRPGPQIPEPGSAVLLGFGAVGFAAFVRRHRRLASLDQTRARK